MTFTPPPNALLLAEALESGEFLQGNSYLTRDGKDCCLGVACKLAVRAGLPITVREDREGSVLYNGESSFLPELVRRSLGFASDRGSYIDADGLRRTLASDNDLRGHDFKQIAHTIRTTPSLYRDE